jgi:hypothetical protein
LKDATKFVAGSLFDSETHVPQHSRWSAEAFFVTVADKASPNTVPTMKLGSKLRRKYYGARRDPGLPTWSSSIAAVGVFALAAYLGWSILAGGSSAEEVAARQENTEAINTRLQLSEDDMLALQEQYGEDVISFTDPASTSGPAATTVPATDQTAVPTTLATPAPVAETTPVETTAPVETVPTETVPVDTRVLVPLPGPGGTVNVDQQALDVARAATVALFTGDFSTVAISPGVEPPTLTRTYPDPLVSEPTVRNVGDENITITFTVDPDGTGPAGLRLINTTVTAGVGGWSWAGI